MQRYLANEHFSLVTPDVNGAVVHTPEMTFLHLLAPRTHERKITNPVSPSQALTKISKIPHCTGRTKPYISPTTTKIL